MTVVLIAMIVKNPVRPSRFAMLMAWLIAVVAVLGFVLQVLPAFYQVNGDAIALALPLHIAVVAMLVAIERRRPIVNPSA
jgi:hypothetical protein